MDIRLGNMFSIIEDLPRGVIDLENEIQYRTMETDTYVLLPGHPVCP